MLTTLQTSAVKFGRLIATTDMKLARRIGELVEIEKITGGQDCDVQETEQGTVCFWLDYELYEVKPQPLTI